MRQLVREGIPKTEVGRRLGISRQAVYRILAHWKQLDAAPEEAPVASQDCDAGELHPVGGLTHKEGQLSGPLAVPITLPCRGPPCRTLPCPAMPCLAVPRHG